MSEKLPVAKCGDCLYFDSTMAPRGECCKNAPKTHGEERSFMRTWWPEVIAEDWCGEFVHRNGKGQYVWVGNYEIGENVKLWRFQTEEE